MLWQWIIHKKILFLLGYLATSASRTYSAGWYDDWRVMNWKGLWRKLLWLNPGHILRFAWGTEGNDYNALSGCRCNGWDPNRALHEPKCRALLLDQRLLTCTLLFLKITSFIEHSLPKVIELGQFFEHMTYHNYKIKQNYTVFRDITPCCPLKVSQHFRGTHRLYLQRRISRARYQRESRWQAAHILKWYTYFNSIAKLRIH
jgi:hypothetical protein